MGHPFEDGDVGHHARLTKFALGANGDAQERVARHCSHKCGQDGHGIVAGPVGSREFNYDYSLRSSRRLWPNAELMRAIILAAGLAEKCRCWAKNLLRSARKSCDSGEANSTR